MVKSKYSYLNDLNKNDLKLLAKKYNIKTTSKGSYKTNEQLITEIKKHLIKINRKKMRGGLVSLTYKFKQIAVGGESKIYSPPCYPFEIIEKLTDTVDINDDYMKRFIGKVAISDDDSSYEDLIYKYKILKELTLLYPNLNIELLSYITEKEFNKKKQLIIKNYGDPLSKYSAMCFKSIDTYINKLMQDIFILNYNGIIHFDIKHDNILYQLNTEHFTIIDFGLSVFHYKNNKNSLIDKIYEIFSNPNQTPALYPIECLIIFLFKHFIFKGDTTITKKEFIDIFKSENIENLKNKKDSSNNRTFKDIFECAMFFNSGLIKRYTMFLNYDMYQIDEKEEDGLDYKIYEINDKYNFFSNDGKIIIKENNIKISFYEKDKIFNYIMYKYSKIALKQLENKNDNITIADIIPDDYYKKIDVFYLGMLFIFINKKLIKENDTDIIKKDIINNCLEDYNERYTITDLYNKFLPQSSSGGKKMIKKIGGLSMQQTNSGDKKSDLLKGDKLSLELKMPKQETQKNFSVNELLDINDMNFEDKKIIFNENPINPKVINVENFIESNFTNKEDVQKILSSFSR